MAIRDPVLDPDRWNRISQMAIKHHEDSVRLLMQNLFPNGYMAGDEDPAAVDKMERLAGLMAEHDHYLDVILDPKALPGDQARANQGLIEEESLKRELFYERTSQS